LGDVGVEFSQPDDGSPVDESNAQFKRFLHRKFAAIFPPDLYFDGLVPPAGGFWARLRHLNLTQLKAQDGWLAIGYEWASDVPVTTASVAR
jgi:hypothetical protein